MGAISKVTAAHVPAWKKLGLKLKNAKEEPDPALHRDVHNLQSPSELPISKKRSIGVEARVEQENVLRKKKVKKSPKSAVNEDITGDALPASYAATESSKAVQTPKSPPPAKRKSVSFTPETKTEDGTGAKQLYKLWVDSQKSEDPSFNPERVNPALKVVNSEKSKRQATRETFVESSVTVKSSKDSSALEREKRKKSKNKNNQSNSKSTRTPDHKTTAEDSTQSTLNYLTTYHTDPALWKFSKSHQNRLLKHLFSLSDTPSSCDPALLSYLRGLASIATRSRIREQALQLREEDEKKDPTANSEPSESTTTATTVSKQQERRHEDAMDIDDPITSQTIARRRIEYDNAVAQVIRQIQAGEDLREEWADRQEWTDRMARRRRAEIVLWAVGEKETEQTVDLTSQYPSITPALTEPHHSTAPASPRQLGPSSSKIDKSNTSSGAGTSTSSATGKRKHKAHNQKKRRPHLRSEHAIPDDFSSSSSSTSSTSRTPSPSPPNNHSAAPTRQPKRLSEREVRELKIRKERDAHRARMQALREELDRLRREVESDSDSDSDSDNGNRSGEASDGSEGSSTEKGDGEEHGAEEGEIE